MSPPPGASSHVPAFNTTRLTLALMVANIGAHLLHEHVGDALIFAYGFIPALFVVPGGGLTMPDDWHTWVSPISYAFLHGDWMHLGINMLFLLAFGTPVERRLGPLRFLAFYLTCAVLAVVASTLSYWITDGVVLIVGASGAIAGLFGATLRFARFRLRTTSPDRPGRSVAPWTLILSFVVINVILGFTGLGALGEVKAVAWQAHLGGFFAGLLLYGLFERRPAGEPQ